MIFQYSIFQLFIKYSTYMSHCINHINLMITRGGGGQNHVPKVYNMNKTTNIQAGILEMVCKFLKCSKVHGQSKE